MVQLQQALDQIPHLVGLVYDDIQVFITALLVIGDAVTKPLGISGDESYGRLELMRYVGNEFIPHVLDLLFLLYVLLQLQIGALEIGYGALQLHGHLVHMQPQLSYLVVHFTLISYVEVQMSHPVRDLRELQDGIRDPAGHEPYDHHTHQSYQDTDIEHEPGGKIYALPDTLQRSPDKDKITARHISPQLDIVRLHGRVRALRDLVFIRLVESHVLRRTYRSPVRSHILGSFVARLLYGISGYGAPQQPLRHLLGLTLRGIEYLHPRVRHDDQQALVRCKPVCSALKLLR